jgi:predicted dehydrogenase
MTKKYRIAVIGATGRGDYGHGIDTVWLQLDNVEIVAVADQDETGRAKAAARLKARNAYADYRRMLLQERPQIVSICPRWLDAHRDMVLACAEVGASMFLEKPMCPTLQEADDMVAACERHHAKLAIAHQTRYSPRVDQVKQLLSAGRLGTLLEMRGRGKEDAKRGGGEDLMVLGTHIMDLMRYFAGDARWCFARVNQGGRPLTKAVVRQGNEGIGPLAGDHITATYGFDNGVVGHFASVADKATSPNTLTTPLGSRFGLQLFGTRGVITMATGSLPAVHFCEDPSWSLGGTGAKWQPISSAGLGQPEPLKDATATLANMLIAKDLIASIEQDSQPRGSVYDARAALEMILAVYESHRLGRLVELPLVNRKHPLTML